MSGSYILAIIGGLYMLWCGFVAVLTFLNKNVAVFHLNGFYVLGFSAAYAICAPFGLAGILGALNRNKSLIKGFLFQYWIGTLFLIGISVVSVLLSRMWGDETLRSCVSLRPPGDPVAIRNSCMDQVEHAKLVTLMFASIQGGTLILFGIILLIFGTREFQDIAIDEETSNLLGKSHFVGEKTEQDLPEPREIYRAPSSAGSVMSNGLSRQPTNASSVMSNGLSRQPTNASSVMSNGLSRQTTNASSVRSNVLSRQPTNASSSPYRGGGLSHQPTLQNHMPPVRELDRSPTNASNSSRGYSPSGNVPSAPSINTSYLGRAPLLSPQHAYISPHTRPLANIPAGREAEYSNWVAPPPKAPALVNGARPPTPPFHEPYNNEDDYTNYWQPAVARTMASNLTRKGLY